MPWLACCAATRPHYVMSASDSDTCHHSFPCCRGNTLSAVQGRSLVGAPDYQLAVQHQVPDRSLPPHDAVQHIVAGLGAVFVPLA